VYEEETGCAHTDTHRLADTKYFKGDNSMPTQNLKNRKTLILITLAVLGFFIVWLTATNDLVAQGDSDHADHADHDDHDEDEDVVKLSDADMKKFGIEIAKAGMGKLPVDVSLPGEVAVNEDRIAHVTPRVSGVVNEVRKTLGDHVHAGEVMAVLDSPEMGDAQVAYLDTKTALDVAKITIGLTVTKLDVAKARRDVAKMQVDVVKNDYDLAVTNITIAKTTVDVEGAEAEIAETDFEWQETIHDNTRELLKLLAGNATIDEITDTFKSKPIGENRQRTLKAYAELNFAQAAYKREKTLREKQISSESDYLDAQKGYTVAKAEFEAITEELEFQNRLALMEKKRAVDAAGRDVKEAKQSVQFAEGAVLSAASAVNAAESTVQVAEMEIRVVEQDLKVARQTLLVAHSALRAAERKLHIFGLSEDEIDMLAKNSQDDHAEVIRYEMRAPFDGVVVEKHIVLGEAVKDDTEVFVVADLSSVWVNVRVYQKDLSVVHKGLPVVLSVGHSISMAKGKIAWVSPQIDEHTRTAKARVVLPNTDGHWRPGLFVTAKIAVDEIEVPLLVPKVALQTVEDRLSVFVKTDEGFEPRPVMLGRSTEIYAEVTKGLQPGQQYVTKGAFTLKAELGKGAFGDGHAH
jgi:cobalt-zinc-cadmium efflux system membrane fusion protein